MKFQSTTKNLKAWRAVAPYPDDDAWVFASHRAKGQISEDARQAQGKIVEMVRQAPLPPRPEASRKAAPGA